MQKITAAPKAAIENSRQQSDTKNKTTVGPKLFDRSADQAKTKTHRKQHKNEVRTVDAPRKGPGQTG